MDGITTPTAGLFARHTASKGPPSVTREMRADLWCERPEHDEEMPVRAIITTDRASGGRLFRG